MLINHRYQVIQSLGEGGFGQAYLAEDTQMPSRRRCVIKQLKPLSAKPEVYQVVLSRFEREAAILEQLGENHPQIPRLYAYFTENQQFYLVQEWIEGITLEALMASGQRLSEAQVVAILRSLLEVLGYIHRQGIIHRDLKPDNIILRSHNQQPVLIDFGAVRETMGTVVNSHNQPTSSIVIGTPGYMASEQAAGRPVPSSDLYSLGLTTIYLLTGRSPQSLGSDPQSGEVIWQVFAERVSEELRAVLDRAVRSHPRDRYSSAEEMLAALSALPGHLSEPQQAAYAQYAQSPIAPPVYPASTSYPTVAVAPGSPSATPLSARPNASIRPVPSSNSPQNAPQTMLSQAPAAQGTDYGGEPTTKSPWLLGLVATLVGIAALVGGMAISRWFTGQRAQSVSIQPTASPNTQPGRPGQTNPGPSNRPAQQPAQKPAQKPAQSAEARDGEASLTPDNPDSPDESADTVALRQDIGLGQIDVYSAPSLAAQAIHYGLPGDRVTLLASGADEGNAPWQQVRFESGAQGWIPQYYLEGMGGQPPTDASLPRPDSPTAEESPSGDRPESPLPAPEIPSGSAQLVGGASGAQVAVYAGPSFASGSPHYGLVGDPVSILGSAPGDDGGQWYQVAFESGATGWVPSSAVAMP